MRVLKIRLCGRAALIGLSITVIAMFAVRIAPAAGELPVKSCQLITAKDVQATLGSGYAEEHLLDNEVQSYCGYKKGAGTAVGIQLTRQIMDAGQYLETVQAGMKQQGKAVTPVAGLGRGAFHWVDNKENRMLFYFGKGNLVVGISAHSGGKPNIDAALKLAKIAYPRLP